MHFQLSKINHDDFDTFFSLLGLPRRFASEVFMFFFREKLCILKQKKKRYNFETAKSRNLDFSWGTCDLFLVQILGTISHVIRVSEPKTEMPIVGLNSFSSKTNGTGRIKLSNLEASGHALSALKNKP